MATREQYFTLLGQLGQVRTEMAAQLASQRPGDGSARDTLTDRLAALEQELQQAIAGDHPVPGDDGLAALIGLGQDANTTVGRAPTPIGVPSYDEAVASQRPHAGA